MKPSRSLADLSRLLVALLYALSNYWQLVEPRCAPGAQPHIVSKRSRIAFMAPVPFGRCWRRAERFPVLNAVENSQDWATPPSASETDPPESFLRVGAR